jgi:hypothetical protein
MMEMEKKNNFTVRTMYSKEMETKKELEKIVRTCIEDVREEIVRKRNEA